MYVTCHNKSIKQETEEYKITYNMRSNFSSLDLRVIFVSFSLLNLFSLAFVKNNILILWKIYAKLFNYEAKHKNILLSVIFLCVSWNNADC